MNKMQLAIQTAERTVQSNIQTAEWLIRTAESGSVDFQAILCQFNRRPDKIFIRLFNEKMAFGTYFKLKSSLTAGTACEGYK